MQDTIIKAQEAAEAAAEGETAGVAGASGGAGAGAGAGAASSTAVGMDLSTGEPMFPAVAGVWDNFIVKRQCLQLSTVLAGQLLLVDEVMRAGRGARNG